MSSLELSTDKSQLPPVPIYWVFSPFTITGTNGRALRARLFTKLRKLGVDISTNNGSWKYRLQYCEGPAILDIEAFFFQRANDVIVDINLLSGDRWTWHRLVARVNNSVSALWRGSFKTSKTNGFVSNRLKKGLFDDSEWLAYLKSKDLNIVRQAMEKLVDYRGYNHEIEKWKAWKY